MTGSNSLTLPAGWQSEENAAGVDLRLVSSKRKFISFVAAVLAIGVGSKAVLLWDHSPHYGAAPWLILTIIFGFFALWCALGDEVWHLEKNRLVHRVGIGGLGYSRSFENADLDITLRFSTKFGAPFHRLNVIASGKSNFLLERSDQELLQLAKFISFYTGWPIRGHGDL